MAMVPHEPCDPTRGAPLLLSQNQEETTMNSMREIWARVRFRWHSFLAALSIALPVLLDQLQVVDLRPLLGRYLSGDIVALLVGLMPSYIALLKPMIHIEDRQDKC